MNSGFPLRDHDRARAVGRFVRVGSDLYLDPHSPGPISPTLGRPEPYSAGAVKCQFVGAVSNDQAPGDGVFECRGSWSGGVFLIDLIRRIDQPLTQWFEPDVRDVHWLDLDSAESVMNAIPSSLAREMRGLALFQTPWDRGHGAVVVELIHLTSDWVEFLRSQEGQHVTVFTTLRASGWSTSG